MDTLTQLEERRREILLQMESIRSLTRGTVAEQFLKVPQKGKKEPELRGPYFLLVKKINGKSSSRRLRTRQEAERIRAEVQNCRRFDALCREFEEVTEQLGILERDAAEALEAVKKKAATAAGQSQEVARVVDLALHRGETDLEAVEKAVQMAVLAAGSGALGEFMSAVGTAKPTEPVLCPKCRARMEGTGPRTKQILTLLGKTSYTRLRYACPSCSNQARYPADELLDISGTSRSPGVQRQVARLGAKETFHEVSEDLRELAALDLSRKDAERISEAIGHDIELRDAREREKIRFQQPPPPETAKTIETLYIEVDGTGAPMVPSEVEGRAGKQADGSAKTREVKLGCIFTQTLLDEKGFPVRDPATTVFTGAIEDAATFGKRIYAQAVRNGLFLARRVVVLADGAEWIRNLAGIHFPMALRIIDLYHAKEHVASLARSLFPKPGQAEEYREHWWGRLLEGDIEAILEQAAQRLPRNPNGNKDACREMNYLRKNIEQMRYAQFREQGYFIGSGVIEAGCKTIVGARLKQSGMEWTVRGANDIVALRCAILSGRFAEYWDSRAA